MGCWVLIVAVVPPRRWTPERDRERGIPVDHALGLPEAEISALNSWPWSSDSFVSWKWANFRMDFEIGDVTS